MKKYLVFLWVIIPATLLFLLERHIAVIDKFLPAVVYMRVVKLLLVIVLIVVVTKLVYRYTKDFLRLKQRLTPKGAQQLSGLISLVVCIAFIGTFLIWKGTPMKYIPSFGSNNPASIVEVDITDSIARDKFVTDSIAANRAQTEDEEVVEDEPVTVDQDDLPATQAGNSNKLDSINKMIAAAEAKVVADSIAFIKRAKENCSDDKSWNEAMAKLNAINKRSEAIARMEIPDCLTKPSKASSLDEHTASNLRTTRRASGKDCGCPPGQVRAMGGTCVTPTGKKVAFVKN